MNINTNYLKLKENYLFATISSKVANFKNNHPDVNVINMGFSTSHNHFAMKLFLV